MLDADEMEDVSDLGRFITVGRLTSTALGSAYRFDGNAERETVSVSRLTIISVNGYGNHAYSALEKLVSALATSAVQSGFRRAGAAVLACSPLRNLPAAIAGGFEQRAQVEISLTHLHRVSAQVNRAETVTITLQEEKNESFNQ